MQHSPWISNSELAVAHKEFPGTSNTWSASFLWSVSCPVWIHLKSPTAASCSGTKLKISSTAQPVVLFFLPPVVYQQTLVSWSPRTWRTECISISCTCRALCSCHCAIIVLLQCQVREIVCLTFEMIGRGFSCSGPFFLYSPGERRACLRKKLDSWCWFWDLCLSKSLGMVSAWVGLLCEVISKSIPKHILIRINIDWCFFIPSRSLDFFIRLYQSNLCIFQYHRHKIVFRLYGWKVFCVCLLMSAIPAIHKFFLVSKLNYNHKTVSLPSY